MQKPWAGTDLSKRKMVLLAVYTLEAGQPAGKQRPSLRLWESCTSQQAVCVPVCMHVCVCMYVYVLCASKCVWMCLREAGRRKTSLEEETRRLGGLSFFSRGERHGGSHL